MPGSEYQEKIPKGKRHGSTYLWSDEEVDFLKEHYGSNPRHIILGKLDRSWEGIKEKAGELELKRKSRKKIGSGDCSMAEEIGEAMSGQKLYLCSYKDMCLGEKPGICRNCW